jgi:hypothetical protein
VQPLLVARTSFTPETVRDPSNSPEAAANAFDRANLTMAPRGRRWMAPLDYIPVVRHNAFRGSESKDASCEIQAAFLLAYQSFPCPGHQACHHFLSYSSYAYENTPGTHNLGRHELR